MPLYSKEGAPHGVPSSLFFTVLVELFLGGIIM